MAKRGEHLVGRGWLSYDGLGQDCSLWDDSVDWVFLEAYDFGEYPEEKFVTTSWYEHDRLEDVFQFALTCVDYSETLLKRIAILDITKISREDEILARYETAYDEMSDEDGRESEGKRGGRQSEGFTSAVIGLIVILLAIAPNLYYWLTR